MEGVAAASGIISLFDLVKSLVEIASEIKASLGMVSSNHTRLRDLGVDLMESMEQVALLVRERGDQLDAIQLRQTLSTLHFDIGRAFERCQRLLSSRNTFRSALFSWRDREEIAEEIKHIERRVDRCYKRFSMESQARTEFSITQFRAEMHTRLDHVDIQLQHRVDEATNDKIKAEELINAQDMTHVEMKQIIRRASIELERSPSPSNSIEKQHLRILVKTLTELVARAPTSSSMAPQVLNPPKKMSARFLLRMRNVMVATWTHRPAQQNTDGISSFAHFGQNGDLTYERQDAVIKVIHISRTLREQNPGTTVETTAKDLHELSVALNDLGMYEDSLQISLEDVKLYRDFVTANPAKFRLLLADSLRMAAIGAYRTGQFERAVSFAEESLGMVRVMSINNPAHRPVLAAMLNTFSHYLGLLGRCHEALDLAQQALELRRSLSSEHQKFLPDLADSLLNASLCYGQADRPDEALDTVREAVSVFRLLASQQPDRYEAPLAASLHGTAKRFMELGRWNEALDMAQQDLEMHLRLLPNRPDVFSQKLAWSQMLVAHCHNNLGSFSVGLASADDAILTLQQLVRQRPAWATPWLVVAYAVASVSLRYLDRPSEAVDKVKNMLAIHRNFNKSNPRFIHRDLATAFTIVSGYMHSTNHYEEANEATDELLHILRALAANGSAKAKLSLGRTLLDASVRRQTVTDMGGCVVLTEEAVDVCQTVLGLVLPPIRGELAELFRQCSVRFFDLGEKSKAMEPLQRCLALYETLAREDPDRYGAELAKITTWSSVSGLT